MLRINHLVVHVPSRCVRFLAGSCFSAIVLFISSMFMYFLMGSLLLAATQFRLPAFAAFVLAFGVLFFVNCFFCSSRQRWPTKGGKKHALFKRHLSKRYIYIILTCDRVVYALKFDGFQEKNIHELNIIICKNALEPMGMVVQIVPPPKKPDSRPFFDKCFVWKHPFPVSA